MKSPIVTIILLISNIAPILLIGAGIIARMKLTSRLEERVGGELWYLIIFRPAETIWDVARCSRFGNRYSHAGLDKIKAWGYNYPGFAAEVSMNFITYILTTSILFIISQFTHSYISAIVNLGVIPFLVFFPLSSMTNRVFFNLIEKVINAISNKELIFGQWTKYFTTCATYIAYMAMPEIYIRYISN